MAVKQSAVTVKGPPKYTKTITGKAAEREMAEMERAAKAQKAKPKGR